MAQRVQIILEDDFDGGEADQTVAFGLDGSDYEIDLSSENAAKLRDALAPWVASARKTGGRRSRRTPRTGSGPGSAEIRAWAQENGMQVSARGRVSAEVRDAYARAHS
ncbi:Lsr2 family protein [Microlunatus elymi]|uniref:Lsr2 family protein n=1 Tax=Microlunatus elymi TaxID=2596828 RepID=A0A516PVK0_9ACTN|nr:Lsr2 family protein [Microlunatus elymi]QDP95206.1 Lsr2 family protein [Microlunatus elymi]